MKRTWWGSLRGFVGKLASGPHGLVRGVLPVNGTEPPPLGTRELLEGFDSMPWLRAVADKVGMAVGCLEWQLLSIRRGGKAVRDRAIQAAIADVRGKALAAAGAQVESDHVFLRALDANPFMTRIGLLKITEIHLDLVGEAYWVKERNGLGVASSFWPVPPHWVIEQPTPSRPRFRVAWRSWQAEIPESEVVVFKEPSPANPYTRGSGIGWALGDEIEVDEYAAKMAKQLFFNQARPDFVIYGFDDEGEKRRFERDWLNRLQGFWRAHKPYFVAGEPKFHEFQRPNMEQLVYPNLRKTQRDTILQVWGAPPEMFGILESSNRATIEAAEYLFAKWIVTQRGERIRAVLQRLAAAEYDERLIVHFVSPVAEDKQFVLSVAKAAPHSRKVDEWRALQNLPPVGGDAGEAFLQPLNSRLGDLEDLLGQAAQPGQTPPARGRGDDA